MRRVAAAVVAVLVAGVACGCTPRSQSRLALRRSGGSLEAVMYVCARDAVARVSVADPDNGDTWAVRPSDGPHLVDSDRVVVVPVLTTPTGWTMAEDSLAGLDPGRRYDLRAGMLRSRPELSFRPGDLDRAGGRVLADSGEEPASVRESEFHREAARSCGK